ncbi:hypothetical protein BB050_00568 [Flavobacterium anhuiense]|uniref:YD repeat-containing protein n=1 Tax=Flavobacterium anhuiense TaxID=459526 RepID=A0AAC9D182_9FLAO|nr:hypothetical protein [Flavobacterium anhuiense]AOC93722.1 hypothetical protein BB050_00568 [Flavobacterium anhuiense]
MKLFFNFLFTNILLLSITTTGQISASYDALLVQKNNIYTAQNLKDSVKAVYLKFSTIKNSLSYYEKKDAIMYNDIRGCDYTYFDNLQRIKSSSYSHVPKSDYLTYNYEEADDYEYDEKDFLQKTKYKITLKHYFPVYDKNLLVKLNKKTIPKKDDVFGEDGKVWKDYKENVYVYNIDQAGRILEELTYFVNRIGKETQNKKYQKKDLFTKKTFLYNEKGQVINQKIIGAGPLAKRIPYTDMGTESPFCEDLQFQYSYDLSGRITKVTMYGCEKIITKQEYTYHPTKDYVETVNYYVTGPGQISNPTRSFIKTFNEQGDVIEKEFIPNYPEQTLAVKKRYYTYEYDSHNNWIKCNMFLEGTPDGEPTLVAERKIEYYN